MDEATTSLTVDKQVPGYWRVTLNHPPINTVDDLMYDEVFDLVQAIDAEPALKVVTFDSANRDYFLAHYGVGESQSRFGKPRWREAAVQLANSNVLSVAVVRGRARGGGSEFALACDIRFASREKAIFGQPEVGFGLIPGGGALERLPYHSSATAPPRLSPNSLAVPSTERLGATGARTGVRESLGHRPRLEVRMRNDPTDNGGLFIGRRPGTAPVRFRAVPERGGSARQRLDAALAAVLLALIALINLSFWGPIPLALLWVGSQVQYRTGSVSVGIFCAFVGMLLTLMGALVIAKRLDHAWILVRRAASHDQREGVLGRVFAMTAVVGVAAFAFWFLVIQGPGSSVFPTHG